MVPSTPRGGSTAERYRRFARREAHGVSDIYENWAECVAEDEVVLDLLDTLTPAKLQPNLVFAAARLHGAAGSYDSFRSTLREDWDAVRHTIMSRSTQTNEAARCGVLLPFLAEFPGPLALIEVGASAGLCLLPDRYSYRYDDGAWLDPDDGPSEVVIPCRLGPEVTSPHRMPDIAWRAGIDLDPLDITDPAAHAWLETLVWPEHSERRERLRSALAVARRDPPRILRGDLLDTLPALVEHAPSDATLVVFHSAVLAYLAPQARSGFVSMVRELPGHWVSNESPGITEVTKNPVPLPQDDGRFLLAVDGVPRALTDPHGGSVDVVPSGPPS